jgi:hypothetical protein
MPGCVFGEAAEPPPQISQDALSRATAKPARPIDLARRGFDFFSKRMSGAGSDATPNVDTVPRVGAPTSSRGVAA